MPRIRVQCTEPAVRAWFNISQDLLSIQDLKYSLCRNLLPAVNPEAVSLSLDNFELLDDSPVDIVRDGDLILIKLSAAVHRSKRKASPTPVAPRKRLKQSSVAPPIRATHPPPSVSSSEDTSDDTSTEDTSSEDDSSSSSEESEEDSDSDSDSDSSSPPSIYKNPPKQHVPPRTAPKPKAPITARTPSKPPVPPGHGKPQTQNRNHRRKLKRQHEKQAKASASGPLLPAHAISTANAIPLGPHLPSQDQPMDEDVHVEVNETDRQPSTPAERMIMMALSLNSNKNKKRNFKASMNKPLPEKIIFGASSSSAPLADNSTPSEREWDKDKAPDPQFPHPHPRLVPPSELQERGELPPNIFVTSVDVEEGMHGKKRKGKGKRRDNVASPPLEGQDERQGEVCLDYGTANGVDEDVSTTSTNFLKDDGTPNIDLVQHKWDTLTVITQLDQLKPGILIGWKALGVNPATYSPEILLHLARIIAINTTHLDVVSFLPNIASFGVDGLAEEPEEESYELAEVLGGGWKLIG
ncbi:hypothetical protein JAAARDRAFT_188385 [Jaapia argillacea MUCL 33604]|uniref:Coilin n=1 Tax=Jaapia argillacea MUCL 33604 TaxID=933084 RepID=A0A067QR08_9AGAM|nr:hypothetical protein JAAARDRAFT_188385 [Jaapia argillacea MUCL 33604]